MKYAAIDFEVGNGSLVSACSLGLSVFEDFELVKRGNYLIRPPSSAGKFHWGNVRIHGIRRQDLIHEPTFDVVWSHLREDIEGSILVCHNASFDTAVLRACLDYFHLPCPECQYICTVKVSQAVWPAMENHRLNTVANSLGITLEHHKAGSDAHACGLILLEALRAAGCADAVELAQKLKMRLGVLGGTPCQTAEEAGRPPREERRRRPSRRRSAARSPDGKAPSVKKPSRKGENDHERVFNRPPEH